MAEGSTLTPELENHQLQTSPENSKVDFEGHGNADLEVPTVQRRSGTPVGFAEKRYGRLDFEGDGFDEQLLRDFDPLTQGSNINTADTNDGMKTINSTQAGKTQSEVNGTKLAFSSETSDFLDRENVSSQETRGEQSAQDITPESQNLNGIGSVTVSDQGNSFGDVFKDIARHQILSVSGSDQAGRLVIVFSVCRMPPVDSIDHHKLFLYMVHTLDQYVESDYSIVYFHHGFTSKNKPSMTWLRSVYRELGRKYRKNVKALYIVHPTSLFKLIGTVITMLASLKFAKKMFYVNCLDELAEYVHLDHIDIPQEVRDYDAQIASRNRPVSSRGPSAVFHTSLPDIPKSQQFGVSLTWMKDRNDGDCIPRVMREAVSYLRENALDVEGIFRRSANLTMVKEVTKCFNQGEPVDFSQSGQVHCAAAIIKKFLRELPEPLVTFRLYDVIIHIPSIPDETEKLKMTWSLLHNELPEHNFALLKFLVHFLEEVLQHSEENRMTASNLAIVFGPNLVWCKSQAASLAAMSQINNFTLLLFSNAEYLFSS